MTEYKKIHITAGSPSELGSKLLEMLDSIPDSEPSDQFEVVASMGCLLCYKLAPHMTKGTTIEEAAESARALLSEMIDLHCRDFYQFLHESGMIKKTREEFHKTRGENVQ